MAAEKVLRLCLPGPPVAWHRAEPKHGGGRRKHPDDKAFQHALKNLARVELMQLRKGGETWDTGGEWRLEVVAFVPDRRRRDASNILKNVEDALSKVVYNDDTQVVDTRCVKRLDRKNPRTIVHVLRVYGHLMEAAR